MGGSYANAASNLPSGDIGNFGTWATPNNQKMIVNNLVDDISEFEANAKKQLVKDYVPVEAKVGRAFIAALSMVGGVLDRTLVPFIEVFMILLLALWIGFEAYQMMTQTFEAKKFGQELVKKLILITVWIIILEQGPAQIFMWVMGPVISVGTYLSDLILNSVSTASGAVLPDTCAAIHNYVASNHTGITIIDAKSTADLLCVPTRLSGFFYTAVAAGWQWMKTGIGQSAFTFIAGGVFVVIFIYNIWKFALMALGIIADLFMGLLFLPFTAIAEVFEGKETSYKGQAGRIFNEFLKIFNAESLNTQILRFVNAAIYFVSLSIVIAICAALLSGVVDGNLSAAVPTLENDGFMSVLIIGCLVAYLANKYGEIVKSIGGSINDELGKQIGGDIKTLWGNTRKTATSWIKAIRKK